MPWINRAALSLFSIRLWRQPQKPDQHLQHMYRTESINQSESIICELYSFHFRPFILHHHPSQSSYLVRRDAFTADLASTISTTVICLACAPFSLHSSSMAQSTWAPTWVCGNVPECVVKKTRTLNGREEFWGFSYRQAVCYHATWSSPAIGNLS